MLKDVKGGEPAAWCNLPNPQAGAPTCLQNSLVTTFESGSPAPHRTPTSTERSQGRVAQGRELVSELCVQAAGPHCPSVDRRTVAFKVGDQTGRGSGH